MKKLSLMHKQLERELSPLRNHKTLRPEKGWIHTIRKALGMTANQLANREGVHRTRIVQLERAEIEDAVTLRTMRSIAKKLNCEFVYALVPLAPLDKILEQQAKKIAIQKVRQASHSMMLEDQATTDEQINDQIKELTKKLLEGSLKNLWNEK